MRAAHAQHHAIGLLKPLDERRGVLGLVACRPAAEGLQYGASVMSAGAVLVVGCTDSLSDVDLQQRPLLHGWQQALGYENGASD